MHAQFQRAKESPDSLDPQLDIDLEIAVKDKDPNPAIVRRLSEMLHLRTMNDLKKESIALHELVIASCGDPVDSFKEMSFLLKKLKDYMLTENPVDDVSEVDNGLIRHRSPVIPDDFRCPISLELMRDPVIVSTGQVFS